MHVSDPHVDYKYRAGTDTKCGDYLCCRETSGVPKDPERQAGKWGSFQCDLPPITLEAMFEYIAKEVKPDVLIWTGDNAPHSIWETNVEEVLDATKNVTEMIKRAFKGQKVTIIPVQGNHDYSPPNS